MPEHEMNAQPLAIIGRKDVVEGFRAFGFEVYPAQEPAEIRAALAQAVRQGVAVCLLEQEAYRFAQEEMDKHKSRPFPVFIPFSKEKDRTLMEAIVRDVRRRATGRY